MRYKWLSRLLAIALAAPLVNCSDSSVLEPSDVAPELAQLLSGAPVVSVDGDWTTTLQKTGSTVVLKRECSVATSLGQLPNGPDKGQSAALPLSWAYTCGCALTIDPPWWLPGWTCRLAFCSSYPTRSCNYRCTAPTPPVIGIG